MTHHDPLRDTLRSRADQLGDASPLSLDDVKGRARGIQRRRAAAAGLAAAAVLAVAVPAGIAVSDRTRSGSELDPVATPSATATAGEDTPDAVPTGGVEITLTTEIDETTYAAEISMLNDRAIVMPDGSEVPVEVDYSAFAPLGESWVAVRRDDEGNAFLDVLDAAGSVTTTEPTTGALAVSNDGTVVAYATPGGELMTLVENADPLPAADPEALPAGILEPVGVIGSGSCVESAGGCAVYFNAENGEQGGAYVVQANGDVTRLPVQTVSGVTPDGVLSGVVSTTDTGSCSVVLRQDGEPSWRTCDHTLGQFSPDGRFVLGHPPYLDGAGDGSIAVLDATTGDVLVEATNSMEHQSFINNVVWDTDGTVLMTVFEKGSWSLMRLSLDGSLSTLAAALGDNMDEVPLHLVTQP